MIRKIAGATLAAIVLTHGWSPVIAAGIDCTDTETALDYWRPVLKQSATFKGPTDDLALELVSCLGSPNPELRDQIGYALYASWLRGETLTDETRRELLNRLSSMMARPPEAIPGNLTFGRSFSALVLSEVMRSDSIRPFMTGAERQALLDQAVQSLGRENDFRGLDANLGWVHPVAHMADLLWRFALHPDTTPGQALAILDGIRPAVTPIGVSYSFNEGDRLARVVAAIIRKEIIDPESAIAWINGFEKPQLMDKWSDAFRSPRGMEELHNTKQFLRALSDQLAGTEIDPQILETLDEYVKGFTQLL